MTINDVYSSKDIILKRFVIFQRSVTVCSLWAILGFGADTPDLKIQLLGPYMFLIGLKSHFFTFLQIKCGYSNETW